MQIHFYIEYDVEKAEDGKDHIVLKKYDFDFDVRENAHFELSNLFNGNKELSKYCHCNFTDESYSILFRTHREMCSFLLPRILLSGIVTKYNLI